MADNEEMQTPDATEAPVSPAAPQALPDDLVLSAEHAALYLCITPAQLADEDKPRRSDSARSAKAAKAPAPTYTVASLRMRPQPKAGASGFEAATQAGLLPWVSSKLPFFAELESRERRGPRTLIGCAWNLGDTARESRLAALLKGRIRCTWLTPAEAATSRWADVAAHAVFTQKGLALLQQEKAALEAAQVASQALPRS